MRRIRKKPPSAAQAALAIRPLLISVSIDIVGPGGSGGGPGGPSRGGQGRPGGGGPAPFHPSDTTNHVAFCRVTATLKPSGGSDIKVEMWLPLSGWNGKFLGLGDFGWAGSIMYPGLLLGLENGYAVASNDSGHDNSLAEWRIRARASGQGA